MRFACALRPRLGSLHHLGHSSLVGIFFLHHLRRLLFWFGVHLGMILCLRDPWQKNARSRLQWTTTQKSFTRTPGSFKRTPGSFKRIPGSFKGPPKCSHVQSKHERRFPC